MTPSSPSSFVADVAAIRSLLWGDCIKPEIFARWSQGFYFSSSEASALEQTHGGPCAIIAPVQAYIVKRLLDQHPPGLTFRQKVTCADQHNLLADALAAIVVVCSGASRSYRFAYLHPPPPHPSTTTSTINGDTLSPSPTDAEHFHTSLRFRIVDGGASECLHHVHEHIADYRGAFGVLLFLYSVIATKGVERVTGESDSSEPLIDATYGYGSQSLINLMITGRAVTYVWDHEQDVGGLKLKGVEAQSDIGFITLMEHMRYITVGTFFKSPKHPVWVLGSETHLSVLFSADRRLVSAETGSEQARRVFKHYDKDGNNFIKADDLQAVLADLQLVSESEYVNLMRRKLDAENLGIVLLSTFMSEFYPHEESSTPDTFHLAHYNGLAQSNCDGEVKYRTGAAVLLESDLRAVCDSNPMLTCLQTKWPTIEVTWEADVTPSLN